MKATWVFLLVVGVVAADVGLGYHYKVPQNSYTLPTQQIGGNSGLNAAYADGVGSGSNTAFQSTGFQTVTAQPTVASNVGSGFYQSGGASSVTGVPAYLYGNSGLGSGYQTQYTSQYQTAEKYQQHYEIHQQPAQVFKHFYIHSAPEEPELPKPRAPIVLPPPQKHYKIIFVKTPSEPRPSPPIIPVQPQNEEKTIVYVLVKKPEEQKEIVIPKVEQKPPSKPEVYFIKYKNQEDPQAVINNIVKDYNGQQVSILNPSIGDSSLNTVSGLGDIAAINDIAYSAGSGANDASSYSNAAALSDISYNGGSVLSDVAYNGGADLSDASYDSGAALSDASYDSGAGFSDTSYNTGAAVSDTSYNTGSGYGNVLYNAIPQSGVSSSSQSFGNEGSAYSLASASSGADLSEANISSTIASPVTVSTTASSVEFDGASAIATSQGVPHETYGTPKFRVK